MLPAIVRAAMACKKLETEGPRLTGLPLPLLRGR